MAGFEHLLSVAAAWLKLALEGAALIALIRTFLNYFLGRERAEQAKLKAELTAERTPAPH